MGGHRHRWMHYATGLPGWMRFGFSPGWVGRGPKGPGPCAQYLTTGQWPTPRMAAAWPPAYGAAPEGYAAPAPGAVPPEQEVQMLRSQADALKNQLDQISARLAELEEVSQ
ncbi:MAG: DUF5320 domain-containing protein [Chloroflexota bacterium]|nr:DUF5320 domain-containing protein [Chloroflexota bacterium]